MTTDTQHAAPGPLALASGSRFPPYRRSCKPWKRIGPKMRRVDNPRNSMCGVPLSELDWGNWSQDLGYLHVRRWSAEDGDTFHRVYPRAIRGHTHARLCVENGALYWLHDANNVIRPHCTP